MPSPSYEALSKDELIKLLLGRDSDLETNTYRKKYGLIWENKPEQFEVDSVGKIPVLKRDPAKSIVSNPDRPTHVLIQGDNYHALKVLAYTHERSVDVIYIDVPYNTGKGDFVYNDRIVDGEDGYRHSKWLSFIAKRLRLATRLLRPDGVLFVSIDDNEQAALTLLCDEVFGEDARIGPFVKKIAGGKNDSKFIESTHEYLLCYGATPALTETLRGRSWTSDRQTSQSLRKWGDNDRRQDRPNLYFPVFVREEPLKVDVIPFDGATELLPLRPDGSDGCWRWSKKKIADEVARLVLKRKQTGVLDVHVVEAGGTEKVSPWDSVIDENTGPGGASLRDILGDAAAFTYPKNPDFMKWVVGRHPNRSAVVLDFFAGSGTTAQAVMHLNAEDGGTRQCILVTNDEGEFKDEQGKLLDGGICTHVTHPRLKKVIEGYTTPKGKDVAGLAENLVFFDTEFVEDRALERSRRELTARSAEMLCLRESTFIEEKATDKRWRSFTDGQGKRLVVVTDAFAASDLRPLLKADKRETLVYVFRFGDDEDPAREYGGRGLEHVTAKPVPDSLLALHRRIQRQEAA